MKGLVLAGGTATRLFPLTIVTNKHLLPIYDRPMIYYPLDTLAGMGIREVMVIVGGKSVGDIVELLGDGRHFGLDLTYRYQRGALGIAHAIGLARDFIGDDAFCVVLGDNILRGRAARGDGAGLRGRAVGRRHAALPRPGPGAVRRGGARRRGPRRRVRGEAGAPQERPDPDRRVLPPPGRVRRHRDASPRPAAASSRSPTSSTTTSPGGGLFTPVYEGHWADAGTVASASCAPPSWRSATTEAGTLPRRPSRARRRRMTDRVAPGAHLLVTGGAGFIGSRAGAPGPGPPRRRPGSRSSTSSPTPATGRTSPRSRGTRSRPPASRSSTATSRTRRSSARWWPRPTPSSTSPPRPTSTARSSTRRRSCAPASSASTCCSRRSAARRTAPGRRTDRARRASSRSAPTRSTATSPTAAASRRTPLAPRSPYAAAKAS